MEVNYVLYSIMNVYKIKCSTIVLEAHYFNVQLSIPNLCISVTIFIGLFLMFSYVVMYRTF